MGSSLCGKQLFHHKFQSFSFFETLLDIGFYVACFLSVSDNLLKKGGRCYTGITSVIHTLLDLLPLL